MTSMNHNLDADYPTSMLHGTAPSPPTSYIDAPIRDAMRDATRVADLDASPRWQLCTLENAYMPRSPAEYVLAGLLKLPSVTIVYGVPGSLKSMLVADAALCIASGKDWLSPYPGHQAATQRKTVQVPVLWLDFDNGKYETEARFDALGAGHGLYLDVPFFYVTMPEPWLDLTKASSEQMLDALVAEKGIKVLVIDNLGAVKGQADENSADMLDVLYAARRIAERNRCAVVLLHHQRKGNGTSARKGETMRGHSSIEQVPDLTLCIERGDGDVVTVVPAKVRGAPVKPFRAMFDYTHIADQPGELVVARFFGIDLDVPQDKATKADAYTAIDVAIQEALAHGELNQKRLINAVEHVVKGGRATIRKRILALVANGRLRKRDAPHQNNACFYSLAENE